MNEVLKLIKKENLTLVEQDLQLKCCYVLAINTDNFLAIKNQLESKKNIDCKEL